jgi:hypothetical protein
MVSGVADVFGQMNAQKMQEDAYNKWFDTQQKHRKEANLKQEQSRQQAENAQAQGLEGVSGMEQKAQQQTEEDRLAAEMTKDRALTSEPAPAGPGDPAVPVSDKFLLSGQGAGSDLFKSDLAGKISMAAQEAKRRIKALATVSSYGPSFGGLDNYTAAAFQKSGGDIDRFNEFRRGDLAVYGTERAIDPLHITYTPGIRI